ncbi:MAG TPA: hypothetical protein VNW51_10150, partial [Mucilaginibacter sp.]|nr:hypothetical protein [Mucilaginibacter sp.]
MKNKYLLLIAIVALFAACKHRSEDNQRIAILMSPDAGFAVSDAKPLKTMVHYPPSFSPDSVVYYLDSVRLESKSDSSPVYIKVDTLHMGQRTIM